jgi:hypothetical protein
MSSCNCAEGKMQDASGAVVETMPVHVHDCEYIARRNSFIPAAQQFANIKAPPDQRGGHVWCTIFSKRMNELMRDRPR